MCTSFKRILKFGWQGFWRNKALSAQVIFIMMITVFVLTSLFVFKQISGFMIEEAQKKVDVSVYFKKEVVESRILEVKEKIETFSNEIERVDYVSTESAKESFIEKHKDDALYMTALANVEGNPFFASLNISAKTSDQYAYIASFLEEAPYVSLIEKVSYNKNREVIDKLFGIASNIEKGGLVLSIFFAILVLLITFNTVKLSIFSSKREIATRKLVGASNWFIRGPFLVQSILYALASVIIFDVIFVGFVVFLNSKMQTLFLDFNLVSVLKSNGLYLILVQLVCTISLGAVSSFLASRKYTKI